MTLIIIGILLVIICVISLFLFHYYYNTPSTTVSTETTVTYDCMSHEVKTIKAILEKNKLATKYERLLDVYSILLCQITDKCENLDKRLTILYRYGANPNDKNAQDLVASVTNLRRNKIGEFIVSCVNLIENDIHLFSNEPAVTADDKQAVLGYNSLFYRLNIDTLNKKCT